MSSLVPHLQLIMLQYIENYYFTQNEPIKSCLLALRDIILAFDPRISEAWKYSMPFFCVGKKMFCYLWIDKVTKHPYIGIVEGGKINHPMLEQGTRARMKILHVDPTEDLPVESIHEVLKEAIQFYK